MFFRLIVPSFADLFSYLFPNWINVYSMLITILPIRPMPSFVRRPSGNFPTNHYFLAVRRHGNGVLRVTFSLSLLYLFRGLMNIFTPYRHFFPSFSDGYLSFLQRVRTLFPTLLITPFLWIFGIILAPLRLVAILVVCKVSGGIHICVPLICVHNCRGFVPFPYLYVLYRLSDILIDLLQNCFLILVMKLRVVLVNSSIHLTPRLLYNLRFLLSHLQLAVRATSGLLLYLFFFHRVVCYIPCTHL